MVANISPLSRLSRVGAGAALLLTLAGCQGERLGDDVHVIWSGDEQVAASACIPLVASGSLRDGHMVASQIRIEIQSSEQLSDPTEYEVTGQTVADDTGDRVAYQWVCRVRFAENSELVATVTEFAASR